MRLKNVFTVPTGQKVTERHLHRVLLSSICSILLCMACLVSTTWAWFTVSIENTDNVIGIANVTMNVKITNNDSEIEKNIDGSYKLEEDVYSVTIGLNNDASDSDAFGERKRPVYVIMSVLWGSEAKSYYTVFEDDSEEKCKTLTVSSGSAAVSFSVSWIKPEGSAVPIDADTTVVIGEATSESAVNFTT